MATLSPEPSAAARPSRKRWLWGLLAIPLLVVGACWWFTDPLEAPPPASASVSRYVAPKAAVAKKPAALEWPEGRLDGDAAKRLLLDILIADQARLKGIAGYTAILHKQERLRGKLHPEQTLQMKVRHDPFSVYFKFVNPEPGKEVVFATGRHDGKVIAHSAGIGRLLIPRLKVGPTDRLALADNRHPVTEAGLLNLVNKLVGYRKIDLTDKEAVTILDRTVDDQGRPRLRSLHTHPIRHPERPFAKVEVLYDPKTKLPVQISSYDWPEPGHEDESLLAERYGYDDLKLGAEFSDLDFDPANPAYAFHRY